MKTCCMQIPFLYPCKNNKGLEKHEGEIIMMKKLFWGLNIKVHSFKD